MCHERYRRWRREEAEESHKLWQDFERTRPVADVEPRTEVTEPEPTEAHEEMTTAER
jgi:hypothetical protein